MRIKLLLKAGFLQLSSFQMGTESLRTCGFIPAHERLLTVLHMKSSMRFRFLRAKSNMNLCIHKECVYLVAKILFVEHHKVGKALVLSFHSKWTGLDSSVTQRKTFARSYSIRQSSWNVDNDFNIYKWKYIIDQELTLVLFVQLVGFLLAACPCSLWIYWDSHSFQYTFLYVCVCVG